MSMMTITIRSAIRERLSPGIQALDLVMDQEQDEIPLLQVILALVVAHLNREELCHFGLRNPTQRTNFHAIRIVLCIDLDFLP